VSAAGSKSRQGILPIRVQLSDIRITSQPVRLRA
jgi:hypothetical protein